jgi:uncharacterized protein (UPF0332 family)
MDFDWVLFHEVGCELIDASLKEKRLEHAYARTAVSRFYYSAFHPLRRILVKQLGPIPRDERSNEYVRTKYLDCGDEETKKLGADLDRLWGRRVESDYRWNVIVDHNVAVTSKKIAQNILNNLEKVNLQPDADA